MGGFGSQDVVLLSFLRDELRMAYETVWHFPDVALRGVCDKKNDRRRQKALPDRPQKWKPR